MRTCISPTSPLKLTDEHQWWTSVMSILSCQSICDDLTISDHLLLPVIWPPPVPLWLTTHYLNFLFWLICPTLDAPWPLPLRPRRGCCPPSPAAALDTRHVWSAEWEAGAETFAAARRRPRLPRPQVATSSQSPRWSGRSSCCRQGNGRRRRGRQGPMRTNRGDHERVWWMFWFQQELFLLCQKANRLNLSLAGYN